MRENEVATHILDLCFAIHRELGPGLLESIYSDALELEFLDHNTRYRREVGVPVCYKDRLLKVGFRADFIVEECVLVEMKSVEMLLPVHKKKVLTYVRVAILRLGLLLNFNEAMLKNGIVRIANNLR